ncbi:zinc ribbon domain-containing protein, partial [Candidatus Gracilibacteria bacterium]|nr:zinc ribbon domain-containing protein [Candidatus Gracilibacteria bacterium]
IGATMAIIYIVQKKIFSKERLEAKRADKGECYICGEKIHLGNTHCIRCGISQEKTCPHCSEVTHMTSDYCGKCGKGMKK